jgi:hypothetical protein
VVIALPGPVDSGNAEYGAGSVEYGDQSPVSSLSCHIPATTEVQPEDLELGAGGLRHLGNGDLLRVVADPDFGLAAMRSIGTCYGLLS